MRLPLLTLALIVAITIAAPLFAPFDPMQPFADRVMKPPDAVHWLGTDGLGRDVLSRVLYGGRRTLLIAAGATTTAILPGLLLGIVTLLGRRLDQGVGVLINSLLAIPALVLALVVITLLGQGAWQIALATGCSHIAAYGQIARTAARSASLAEYVNSARAIGATRLWIIRRHILPTAAPTLLAYVGVIFSYSIINSAALSFLGLGGEPGIPDWGTILAEGRTTFRSAPWVGIVPGIAITVTVAAVNALADRLGRP
jgi:peptide/nickel transport system permease protein